MWFALHRALHVRSAQHLEKGGTEDWRKVLKEATGENISTRAMIEYFKPLMA
jgi:peptidyl-dipeptidase A